MSKLAVRGALAACAVPLSISVLALGGNVPATAAVVSSGDAQICQYSFDQNWRNQATTLSGELFNVTKNQVITDGAHADPGDRIQLRDASFSASLPKWMLTYGYDGNMLPAGHGSFALEGWIALEGVNTVEGVQAPIHFQTQANSHVVAVNGVVDEGASSLDVPVTDLTRGGAAIPTWTAAGGPVSVRQTLGTRMAPIPAGRDGALVAVNGGLFVGGTIGTGDGALRLFLDCTPGAQLNLGAAHSDNFPVRLGGATVRVPSHDGTVTDGGVPTALAEAVDVSASTTSLPRAAAGAGATLTGTSLQLRLTEAQKAAWLGAGGTPTISATTTVLASGATQAAQPVSGSTTVSVPASGGLDVSVPLSDTTWTATGNAGVDVRLSDTVTLTAGGKTLTLERSAASKAQRAGAYPFGVILGPDPRVPHENEHQSGPSPVNPPTLDGPKGFAPPPVLVKRTTVKVASSSLKRSKGKVRIRLTNLSKTATTAGRFRLVTTSKYRVGKSRKKRAITLVSSTSFSLKKGRSVTFNVKLSKDAAALLKTRKSVRAKLTVTPKNTKSQKTVTKTLTVKR